MKVPAWGKDDIDVVKEYTKSLMWRSLKEIAAEDGIRENEGPSILHH